MKFVFDVLIYKKTGLLKRVQRLIRGQTQQKLIIVMWLKTHTFLLTNVWTAKIFIILCIFLVVSIIVEQICLKFVSILLEKSINTTFYIHSCQCFMLSECFLFTIETWFSSVVVCILCNALLA